MQWMLKALSAVLCRERSRARHCLRQVLRSRRTADVRCLQQLSSVVQVSAARAV